LHIGLAGTLLGSTRPWRTSALPLFVIISGESPCLVLLLVLVLVLVLVLLLLLILGLTLPLFFVLSGERSCLI